MASQVLIIALLIAFFRLFPQFIPWTKTPVGTFTTASLGLLAAFAVVPIYARSFDVFEIPSLRKGVSPLALGIALGLGLIGVWITQARVVDLSDKFHLARPFVQEAGPEKYLWTLLLLVGPIFEEIILRGFLYRAFRQSYGVIFSTAVIVGVAALSHWSTMTASIWIFLLIGALQAFLCLTLERTGNLWNCIACHCLYNATLGAADFLPLLHGG